MSVDLPAPFSPSSACTSPSPQVEVDRVVGDERAEPLRDPAELERQIGARARGTRIVQAGRPPRLLSFIGLVGILTLPAFICLMSAFDLDPDVVRYGAVDALDAGALLVDAEQEIVAAAELVVHDLADDVDDRDVDALGRRGEQLLGADLQRLVGVDADPPVALVARRVDGAEAALARDLEDDVRALCDLLLGEALALVLRDEVAGIAVEQLDARVGRLRAVLEAGDVPVDRRDRDAADARDDLLGVETLGVALLEQACEVADQVPGLLLLVQDALDVLEALERLRRSPSRR